MDKAHLRRRATMRQTIVQFIYQGQRYRGLIDKPDAFSVQQPGTAVSWGQFFVL
jgi:hypothetical protein